MRRVLLASVAAVVMAGTAWAVHVPSTEAEVLLTAPAGCSVDASTSDAAMVGLNAGRMLNNSTSLPAKIHCPLVTSADVDGPMSETDELTWVQMGYHDATSGGSVSGTIGSFDLTSYTTFSLCSTVSSSYFGIGDGVFTWYSLAPCMLSGRAAFGSITLPTKPSSSSISKFISLWVGGA